MDSESSKTSDDSKGNGSLTYEAVVAGSQKSAWPSFVLLWLIHIAALLDYLRLA